MKRKHLFHSFVFLMTGLVTLAFGHVAQADNTTTAESSTSETMQKIEPKKDVYVIASDSAFAPFEFQNANGEYEGIDVKHRQTARIQHPNGLSWILRCFASFRIRTSRRDDCRNDGNGRKKEKLRFF